MVAEAGGGSTVLLHDLEEFDDDFAWGTDQDLSFSCLFGIVLWSISLEGWWRVVRCYWDSRLKQRHESCLQV